MMEEEFLTLVKYLKEIEFKINPLYQICDKEIYKTNKIKSYIRNEHLSNTRNGNFQVK